MLFPCSKYCIKKIKKLTHLLHQGTLSYCSSTVKILTVSGSANNLHESHILLSIITNPYPLYLDDNCYSYVLIYNYMDQHENFPVIPFPFRITQQADPNDDLGMMDKALRFQINKVWLKETHQSFFYHSKRVLYKYTLKQSLLK